MGIYKYHSVNPSFQGRGDEPSAVKKTEVNIGNDLNEMQSSSLVLKFNNGGVINGKAEIY